MPDTPFKIQRVIQVHPDHPDPDVIKQAAGCIKTSGVVIFPTRCLYGLAADALDPKAVHTVFSIKKREKNNPLLVLVRSPKDLEGIVTKTPDQAKILMHAFWPGSLTLVFEAKPCVCKLLTAGTGKIGVRIPSHPVARALVHAAGRPITGTSANLSGSPGCSRISDMPGKLIQAADMVLDAGTLKGGTGSTILDITCDPPRVLRQGTIPSDTISQTLCRAIKMGKKVNF
ncbi:MAG: L-threonylcarbamoyladenylate synthase [Desulfotignum sp.]|nr:L-threonylcarbamoyladenylate synthase [Desulfotignum sp.]